MLRAVRGGMKMFFANESVPVAGCMTVGLARNA